MNLGQILFFPFKIAGLLILPFFLLLRGSVFLYEYFQLNPWLCLLAGLATAGIVLYFYMAWGWKKLIGRRKKKFQGGAAKIKFRLTLLILLVFAGYGLLYISGDNAKTQQIREDYGKLHPILRMGLSSVTLFDSDLVITDLRRSHGDYGQMGMREPRNSLHFPQSDGYVHAIDLRTRERSEIRNQILELWFKMMGFRTLRHIGTADHLHVSIRIHEVPAAI